MAYGITAITNGQRVDGFDDITTSRRQAENFVVLCNTMELSVEHLRDAVDDFILA